MLCISWLLLVTTKVKHPEHAGASSGAQSHRGVHSTSSSTLADVWPQTAWAYSRQTRKCPTLCAWAKYIAKRERNRSPRNKGSCDVPRGNHAHATCCLLLWFCHFAFSSPNYLMLSRNLTAHLLCLSEEEIQKKHNKQHNSTHCSFRLQMWWSVVCLACHVFHRICLIKSWEMCSYHKMYDNLVDLGN